MKTMQQAMLVAVMTVTMGLWMVEAHGEGTNRPAATGHSPRFTIQADTNCVVDNLTGLMWARNANLPGATQSWAQAVAFCKNMNYGGHTDWRLPNLNELLSLVSTNYTRPSLSNTAGTGKWQEGDAFTGVKEYDHPHGYAWYWVTTTTAGEPAGAWLATFFNGSINRDKDNETTGTGFVWPVRDVKPAPVPARDAWFRFSRPSLVKNRKPCADIVISAKPPRAAKLAAAELQTYIVKISGAKLPIVTAPGTNGSAHIYVGKSEYTDQLKVTDEGLKYGAFRMVSGKDYLVLLGHDKDFALSEYADRFYPDPQALKAWDARTGEHWGNPGAPGWWGYSPTVGIWELDERGTLNAVYEFLRGLGVRWYMPGDLGEIVPKLKTIALTPVDKTVKPDFPYRNLGDYAPSWRGGNRDGMLYKLRIGVDASLGLPGPHGLTYVYRRDEVKKAHPEYFALLADGTRSTDHACLSSAGMFDYTVKYARAVFDIYPDLKYISFWPNDGFYSGSMCQCAACKGKLTPKRGAEGELSDYVWDFIERVAKELYKTHPDRKVICGAYGAYTLPPEKIAKFSPNVMVAIKDNRASFNNPEVRANALAFRKGYLEKLAPGNLQTYNHYLNSGSRLPSYFPHAIAEDLHSLKGLSQGEFIELTYGGGDMHAPGFNHLDVYVTTRYYWNADQDIEALLNEYYEKFYGPAAKEMKAFIEYSEANWTKMLNDPAPIARALELVAAARKAAGDGVYGRRVDLLVDYCAPMTNRMAELAIGRKKDLKFTAPSRGKPPVKLDGRLDKAFWKDLPAYSLRDLKSGQSPTNGLTTTFRVAWCDDEAFYFGIRCEEPDIKGLNIKTSEPDNPVVWDGDAIELIVETQRHAYYQLAIGPNGVLADADRKVDDNNINMLWNSGAQAAAHMGDGYWSLEVRVPVAGDEAETINPLIGIAGHKPTAESPWYFNLGRQRMRGTIREHSASAPPKANKGFLDRWNFGQLFVK